MIVSEAVGAADGCAPLDEVRGRVRPVSSHRRALASRCRGPDHARQALFEVRTAVETAWRFALYQASLCGIPSVTQRKRTDIVFKRRALVALGADLEVIWTLVTISCLAFLQRLSVSACSVA